jgi:hypothetical protein
MRVSFNWGPMWEAMWVIVTHSLSLGTCMYVHDATGHHQPWMDVYSPAVFLSTYWISPNNNQWQASKLVPFVSAITHNCCPPIPQMITVLLPLFPVIVSCLAYPFRCLTVFDSGV